MADSTGGQAAANTAKPTSSVKLVLLGEAAVGKSSLVLRFVSNTFQPSKEPTIGAAFLTQKIALPPPKSRTIKFEIWDTAGQERFASLAPMYYRNAQAALVCYDVTKAPSLGKARRWVEELQRQASPGLVVGLVGCKVDLVEDADAGAAGAGAVDDEADGGAAAAAAAAAAASAASATTAAASSTADGADGADAGAARPDGGEHSVRQVKTEEARAYAESEGLLFFETSAKTGANIAEVFAAIADAIPEAALKGARGAAGGAAGGGAAGRGGGGAGVGGAGDAGRVVLGQGGAQGPKEGCAC